QMKFLAISLPRHLSPWPKKAPAIAGRGKLSRADRHQSSALSALLHHVGPNTSQMASFAIRRLVRLCQRVVRRCIGHYKLVSTRLQTLGLGTSQVRVKNCCPDRCPGPYRYKLTI